MDFNELKNDIQDFDQKLDEARYDLYHNLLAQITHATRSEMRQLWDNYNYHCKLFWPTYLEMTLAAIEFGNEGLR